MKAADLFCGAGGSTTGAVQAGVDVVLAVNHWRTAVLSHGDNHPDTRHICARIDDVDPRNDKTIPNFDLLLASPECTHHSIARGGRPIDDQKRATPWHVVIWAEAKRPKWIVVENVREFVDWGPLTKQHRPNKRHKGKTFKAWVRAIESLGYHVEWKILNAADYGAATKRHRLFVVARRGRCTSPIQWPEPTHDKSNWRAAHEIIDWSIPAPSIFGRKKPLADKTLKRIEIGLRKFVGEAADPFIVTLRRNMAGRSIQEPLATITAGAEHHAVTVPFQLKAMGRNPGATKGIDAPLPTIVAARENHSIVVPYLIDVHDHRRDDKSSSVEIPLPTIVAKPGNSVVVPFMVPRYGEREGQEPRTHSTQEPLPTVTATNAANLVLPFLTKYHGTGGADSIDEPLSTATAKPRHGLAMTHLLQTMKDLSVVDVGFRMLDVPELAAAQGFPDGYMLHGTKAERIRQVGNAVVPNVMKAICQEILAA